MKQRLIWSVVLLAMAVITVLFIGGQLGVALGSLFVMGMVVVWIIPWGSFANADELRQDPGMRRILRVWLGLGLGLLSIIMVVIILPPAWVSWVLMGIGLVIILWLFFEFAKIIARRFAVTR